MTIYRSFRILVVVVFIMLPLNSCDVAVDDLKSSDQTGYDSNQNRYNEDEARKHRNKALLFERSKEYENAIIEYRKAAGISKQPSDDFFQIGLIYYENLDDIEKSIEEFEKAVKYDSKYEEPYYYLYKIYKEKSEYTKSIDYLSRFIDRFNGEEWEVEELKEELKLLKEKLGN